MNYTRDLNEVQWPRNVRYTYHKIHRLRRTTRLSKYIEFGWEAVAI